MEKNRSLNAYSIGGAIVGFFNISYGVMWSAEEFVEQINYYAQLLMAGDKEPLITLLKPEVTYNSFAIDLLEMVYAF